MVASHHEGEKLDVHSPVNNCLYFVLLEVIAVEGTKSGEILNFLQVLDINSALVFIFAKQFVVAIHGDSGLFFHP